MARATVDGANRVWASVIARDGAPVSNLEQVYAGDWLREVRSGVEAMRARGQYRLAQQTAPVVFHSVRRLDDGRIEATVTEQWQDRLYSRDGALVRDLSGAVDQRYVLQRIGTEWRVVESQLVRR